jgi:hypothetical protein
MKCLYDYTIILRLEDNANLWPMFPLSLAAMFGHTPEEAQAELIKCLRDDLESV